jgi:membrane-bound lytic murein transglycosylase A
MTQHKNHWFIRYLFLWMAIFLIAYAWHTLFYQYHQRETNFKEISAYQLHHYKNTSLKNSFLAFLKSCDVFMKKLPDTKVGARFVPMTAKDWQPLCKKAYYIDKNDEKALHDFFNDTFKVIEFTEKGLFTGYYLPEIMGRNHPTKEFQTPIYGVPKDLITINLETFDPSLHKTLYGRFFKNQFIPYYTRKEINDNKQLINAPILAYVKNTTDRLYLEIQGSGIIKLPHSEKYITYSLQNGHNYIAIGKVMVDRGLLKKEKVTMQTIKAYLLSHPKEADDIMNQNPSFVFFKEEPSFDFKGAQGAYLTPKYSLAVDRVYIPLGAPIWLSSSYPNPKQPSKALPLEQLMIAQDTGGAIKGMVRGDVFWGYGNDPEIIAGHMKSEGKYWLFLPKHVNLNTHM